LEGESHAAGQERCSQVEVRHEARFWRVEREEIECRFDALWLSRCLVGTIVCRPGIDRVGCSRERS
jgi:hypothetical protein